MCGGFTNELTWPDRHDLYRLSHKLRPAPKSNMRPRYNIAPRQDVDSVHLDKTANIEMNRDRWWLVPFFAKKKPKAAMLRTRIKPVDTSGAFREGFESRLCLIPVDGCLVWTTSVEDGTTDPWLLQLPDAQGFSSPAWAHYDNLGVTSCTINSGTGRARDRAFSHSHADDHRTTEL